MQPAGHTRIYTTLTDATGAEAGLQQIDRQTMVDGRTPIDRWHGLALMIGDRHETVIAKTPVEWRQIGKVQSTM